MSTEDANNEIGKYSDRWEQMWAKGLEPGEAFDACRSSPALEDILKRKLIPDVEKKRILIPGCGRGYDVETFARFGAREVVGLELAATAAAEATKYLKSRVHDDDRGKMSVKQGDFFNLNDDAGYDIGFDYTFFCALEPSDRKAWAHTWARLIKQEGVLVTLIFPVDEDMARQGPPWPVSVDMYRDYLIPAGFTLRHIEKVEPALSHKGRQDREYMALWSRGAI